MTRVGVIGHTGYPGLPAALRSLIDLAPSVGMELYFEEDMLALARGGHRLDRPNDLDALLTLGGDGTLLRGARFIAPHRVPILGVNMGRLGFLTSCNADELPAVLGHLARGDYRTESRMTLEGMLDDSSGAQRARWVALNDVVAHKGGVARVVSLRVAVNGEPIATYLADGIVVSTPTGSTAYSLSAGGPVVFPTLESIVVTPVSAHTLAIRPLILPATAEVTVQPEDAAGNILVTVDGQVGTTFATGETLRVRKAEHGILIVRLPTSRFFDTLRTKLGWGGLPERDGPT